MSARLDVIKKTIFRKLKAYCSKEFKSFYNFIAAKRKRNVPQNKIFIEADRYLTYKYGISETGHPNMALVALVDIKKNYVNSNPAFAPLRFKLRKLIKCFNLNLMEDVLEIKDFSRLVILCLYDQKFLNYLLGGKDPKLQEKYMQQIGQLRSTILQMW